MWKQPWTYLEGIAIAIGLIIVGLMLQLSVGPLDWAVFLFPANVIVLIVYVLALVAAYLCRRRSYAVRFLSTPSAAVPALVVAALLTVVMGLTPQVAASRRPSDPIGLTRMLSFWPFILIYIYVSVIVGLVSIGQIFHFAWRRLPSLLCHVGLFVVLVCGTLGSADMQRVKMYCEQGSPEWLALDEQQNVVELPLAIQLERFTIDEYPPKLMMIDGQGIPVPKDKPATLLVDSAFVSGDLNGWKVSVVRRLDNAAPAVLASMAGSMPQEMMGQLKMDSLGMAVNKGGFVPFDGKGAQCALLVKATKGGTTREGWVTCGSYLFPYQGLELPGGLTIAMPSREPERFASLVDIYTKSGKNIQTTIEVNKPFTVEGWKVYQLSYNEQMGKWSTLSVFELVRDPWLPVVYVGIFFLLAGAVLMIFAGVRR
jgi:hypothetical protein